MNYNFIPVWTWLLIGQPHHVACLPPNAPHNLTVLRMQTRTSLIAWNMPGDDVTEPDVNMFRITVRPLRSEGAHVSHLVDVHPRRRSFQLEKLQPHTPYEVTLVARNQDGDSNVSEVLSFRTLSDSEEVTRTTVTLTPGEAAVVISIIVAWCCSFAFFLHKWGTIRILQPNEPRYKAKPPKNIETVKVVKRSTDSVIYKGYSRQLSRTMLAREKRIERQYTMPNIKLGAPAGGSQKDLTSTPASSMPSLPAKPKIQNRKTMPVIPTTDILDDTFVTDYRGNRKLSTIQDMMEEDGEGLTAKARSVSASAEIPECSGVSRAGQCSSDLELYTEVDIFKQS